MLAGSQDGGGEAGVVGGIGEMLGLHAKGGTAGIGFAGLAVDAAVEKIAGVKLEAGLGGEHFEDAAG